MLLTKLPAKAVRSKTMVRASQHSANFDNGRTYFTLMDRVRDAVQVPWKHVSSFFEPDGQNYEAQLPETSRLYGNSAMNFNAYLTENAIDLNTWHDMESTQHAQFGTVDNPVLIFTSDSSWRIIICQGPGSEEDSHTHEKMYYFIREGPLHRCHLCGQVFKLVRLKDEFSEINDYYSLMFAQLPHYEIAEDDTNLSLHTLFGDRPSVTQQSIAGTNVYIHVNSDEMDHMLTDPAYKMEKVKEAHEKLVAMHMAYQEVDRQVLEDNEVLPEIYDKALYENWWNVEKAIRKFDRQFNKIEKFDSRMMLDPENHDRRERRMEDRKSKRWLDNYTYFFGGLTEEEQMYRDYFETDIENNPEDEKKMEQLDEINMAQDGAFQFKNFDFLESHLKHDNHEYIDDVIDQKIFKYKYRIANDAPDTYFRRMDRVVKRSLARAETRDAEIEVNLAELLEKENREGAIGQQVIKLFENGTASEDLDVAGTRKIREYMLRESEQQYRDYYESDGEEQQFFEYLDTMGDRDKIRIMEIFQDFTINNTEQKRTATIPKRENNPELSVFQNLALDFVDFKDRVKPLASDMSLLDKAADYQREDAATAR